MHLVVRFSASIPDLPLTIPFPHSTSGLALKRLVRSHLPPLLAHNRIRLIHAGRVLSDTAPLASSLPAPPPNDRVLGRRADHGGKGKAPVRDVHLDVLSDPFGSGSGSSHDVARVYIHCSVGDVLSVSELAAEATNEATAQAALTAASHSKSTRDDSEGSSAAAAATPTTATPGDITTSPPQGFDRLLTAGFSPTEVASLRSQFQTILSHTHTPDTMPTGNALRSLEDRWLDTDSFGRGAAGAGGATTEVPGEEEGGGLDDLLRGTVMGCVWPMGALVWGFREEGVWTQRKRIAVFTGIMINLAFGFVKLTS
ncbi:hypothetical protein P152DRAFT_458346 [Eremomyces bilateralis CBS 781.70]|uniref:Ubiquitin-like domain-containing protein n=1 Tax=Eremomyces bilateralis CBS 781.70 TaxID=1392243 RepID=A0A6G1G318_9PEZI|nr:uncharacterized protein P152DRAFT_458346 [Eremomyces bilateralis CBS 781.70]KAF1812505.1 hypothetical protein P152DRAFT_458346 [Eremomyces bilateralis CBS 781.70]